VPLKLLENVSAKVMTIEFPEVLTVVPVPDSVHALFDIEEEEPGLSAAVTPLPALFSRYSKFVDG
jgi:hypothetical protein